MSAQVDSTGVAEPVRFARTRVVLAVLVVVGILVSLVANCARTLTNTDTYFHLRFGQEFLDGWSLRHSGQRQHVRDPGLGADAVAVGDRDGQDRGLVRAGGRRLAVGTHRDRALRHGVRRVPRPRRAAGRGRRDRGRPRRDAERPLDAAAGDQLPAGRGRRRRLASHRSRRPGPLVAGAARLAVGDAARDVAAGPRDRRCRRRRPRPGPGTAAAAAARRHGAGGLGRRRGPDAGRPGALHRGRRGRVAVPVLRRVGVAGLDELGVRRGGDPARC